MSPWARNPRRQGWPERLLVMAGHDRSGHRGTVGAGRKCFGRDEGVGSVGSGPCEGALGLTRRMKAGRIPGLFADLGPHVTRLPGVG